MKLVILSGGLGSRISEETYDKPKPLIEIGGKPIIWHIMKYYEKFGFNEFIICCGYKGYKIKQFFRDYYTNNSDLSIDIANNKLIIVFKVGISPINDQVNKPNINVPIPNPANLIFQKAPKCSYDHLVL